MTGFCTIGLCNIGLCNIGFCNIGFCAIELCMIGFCAIELCNIGLGATKLDIEIGFGLCSLCVKCGNKGVPRLVCCCWDRSKDAFICSIPVCMACWTENPLAVGYILSDSPTSKKRSHLLIMLPVMAAVEPR